jgi:hypothetical protein
MSGGSGVTPRHNTVPQFYLRNFANEDGHVLLVDRDDVSRTYPTVVRKACAEVGFYRMDPEVFEPEVFEVDKESERPDPEVVEQHLSQFERAAAPGIYKLPTRISAQLVHRKVGASSAGEAERVRAGSP